MSWYDTRRCGVCQAPIHFVQPHANEATGTSEILPHDMEVFCSQVCLEVHKRRFALRPGNKVE